MVFTLDRPNVHQPVIQSLDNGLTIIAEQIPVDAVSFNIWLDVGSAIETDDINGMAHFLEHMMFKGTPNLALGEFEQMVEQRGAMTNAATSQDYTHYYITTAPEDFGTLAPLQVDLLLNPSLEEEHFTKERLVVLEEIRRSQDNPSRRSFNKAIDLFFQRLPYRRPILGPEAIIADLHYQQMRDFHSHWYHPSAMTATVVGNLPVEQLIDVVATAYGKHYQRQDLPFHHDLHRSKSHPPEPKFDHIIRQEHIDPDLQQARLIMGWRVPGLEHLNETYGLDVVAAVLGQGKMARLFRDLREERGLVTQIGANNMTFTVQGIFYIYALMPGENLGEVEALIKEHIHRLSQELINAKDLERIGKKVASRHIFGMERPSDRSNLYGYYYSQLSHLEPAFNYVEKIQSYTAEDLRQTVVNYLDPNAYAITTIKPG
ncbi:MAG: insulinase family protein [Synechococcaceae cyanobacterium RL_1_2]|nr:insulinase family protein [Synechococcaceae cyanobacterium RL_1_2]